MPDGALHELAAQLRADESVISPRVRDPAEAPVLGPLAAAGERGSRAPGAYALVVEAVREGYLAHYGEPRLIAGADAELRLLAGDYLYALGLERLARLGDMPAVRHLAELIALAAQLHAAGLPAARAGAGAGARADVEELAGALWLGTALAVGTGAGEPLERARAELRREGADPLAALREAAEEMAAGAGLLTPLAEAAAGIDLRPPPRRTS